MDLDFNDELFAYMQRQASVPSHVLQARAVSVPDFGGAFVWEAGQFIQQLPEQMQKLNTETADKPGIGFF